MSEEGKEGKEEVEDRKEKEERIMVLQDELDFFVRLTSEPEFVKKLIHHIVKARGNKEQELVEFLLREIENRLEIGSLPLRRKIKFLVEEWVGLLSLKELRGGLVARQVAPWVPKELRIPKAASEQLEERESPGSLPRVGVGEGTPTNLEVNDINIGEESQEDQGSLEIGKGKGEVGYIETGTPIKVKGSESFPVPEKAVVDKLFGKISSEETREGLTKSKGDIPVRIKTRKVKIRTRGL